MNKGDFTKIYRKMNRAKVSSNEAAEDINILLETIKEGLKISGKISFVKRGIFEVVDKKARNIANPSTWEIMRIKPQRTVKFRASKSLKWKEEGKL